MKKTIPPIEIIFIYLYRNFFYLTIFNRTLFSIVKFHMRFYEMINQKSYSNFVKNLMQFQPLNHNEDKKISQVHYLYLEIFFCCYWKKKNEKNWPNKIKIGILRSKKKKFQNYNNAYLYIMKYENFKMSILTKLDGLHCQKRKKLIYFYETLSRLYYIAWIQYQHNYSPKNYQQKTI